MLLPSHAFGQDNFFLTIFVFPCFDVWFPELPVSTTPVFQALLVIFASLFGGSSTGA